MDRFAGSKLNLHFHLINGDIVIVETVQVHFHAADFLVVDRAMPKLAQVKVTAEVLIPAKMERAAKGNSTNRRRALAGSPSALADSRIGVGMSCKPA